ncbi:PhzF family phenazine biosynthesis protein [Streptomyces sp. NPDC046324]|uniref:PhzF family phenazine biosynthesis protein n=1 Tax=Streptomyces sp. NPDC046324 TaxID=3154915 RepID=UPI0033D15705
MSEPVHLAEVSVPFAWVDVFADIPLTGNPLPVVWEAELLDEGTMRAVAREFNQSETTFVLPPTLPGAHRRLRSFTPSGAEVTGAGHNTLGAWWLLASAGCLDLTEGTTTLIQEIGGRTLPVRIDVTDGQPTAILQFQAPPEMNAPLDIREELALALGLKPENLDTSMSPQVVSTGAAHLLVPATDRAAVDRAAPDAPRLASLLAQAGGQGCYLFTSEPPSTGTHAYTRFFNPTVGIWEDPATGSAAGPLAAYLVAHERIAAGVAVNIEQGHRMGRPSRLTVHTGSEGIAIAGRGVTLAEGRLRFPHTCE